MGTNLAAEKISLHSIKADSNRQPILFASQKNQFEGRSNSIYGFYIKIIKAPCSYHVMNRGALIFILYKFEQECGNRPGNLQHTCKPEL